MKKYALFLAFFSVSNFWKDTVLALLDVDVEVTILRFSSNFKFLGIVVEI